MDLFQKRIYLYEIECETINHIYVGITKNVAHRYRAHLKGNGVKFTQIHGVKKIKIIAEFEFKKDAEKAERNHMYFLKEKYPHKTISMGNITLK